MDRVGDEAEERADPKEQGEAPEQVLAELHPFWRRLRGRKSVRTIPFQVFLRLGVTEALKVKVSIELTILNRLKIKQTNILELWQKKRKTENFRNSQMFLNSQFACFREKIEN